MSDHDTDASHDDLSNLSGFFFYSFIVHPATAWIMKPGRFERKKSIMYAITFLVALAAIKTGKFFHTSRLVVNNHMMSGIGCNIIVNARQNHFVLVALSSVGGQPFIIPCVYASNLDFFVLKDWKCSKEDLTTTQC